jgi:sugar O-acyltransferase (sialic acid O-acetyltransferase NeuD family)
MQKDRKLVIFGNGEFGSLARYYFDKDSRYEVVAFAADDEFAKEDSFEGLPLVPFSKVREVYPSASCEMHVAVSYKKLNKVREEKYLAAKAAGYTLASYVSTKSVYWDDLSVGDNCFILENQTIQPTVKIGNNVMIWSGNHLGHGCEIMDHAYMASHICVSGHVKIGSRTFIGVNAAFKDFINIGEDSFIAMSATVTKDVTPGSVVLGPQGTVFEPDSRQAASIKKKYFG